MMKKILALLTALMLLLCCLAGCDNASDTVPADTGTETPEQIDYAASVTLDMNSSTAKQVVTVKTFVDGDTTHFYVPTSVDPSGALKARYLAVNTPESTGKIEPWGKKASNFTRSKLESADSIIIESDNETWNLDSTGGRYLVWVWYRPAGSVTYRNLNIELLQNGLSIASKAAENRYGEVCIQALFSAEEQGLNAHSDEDDPDFYYGDAQPVTLKHLRTNLETYKGTTVAFEANVAAVARQQQTAYVEEYDPETDMYFGMTIYYGYSLSGRGMEILSTGNRVKIVGSVQYYETGGTWQIADIKYVEMRPNDPKNIQLISEGNQPAYTPLKIEDLKSGTVDIPVVDEAGEEVIKTFNYGDIVLSSSVSLDNLKVQRVSTTTNEESTSFGAMTLKCVRDGESISVRTVVLYDENGEKITADAYEGKTINVRGIVDYYMGGYQIKVLAPEDITVVR